MAVSSTRPPSGGGRTVPTIACHLAIAVVLTIAVIVMNASYSPSPNTKAEYHIQAISNAAELLYGNSQKDPGRVLRREESSSWNRDGKFRGETIDYNAEAEERNRKELGKRKQEEAIKEEEARRREEEGGVEEEKKVEEETEEEERKKKKEEEEEEKKKQQEEEARKKKEEESAPTCPDPANGPNFLGLKVSSEVHLLWQSYTTTTPTTIIIIIIIPLGRSYSHYGTNRSHELPTLPVNSPSSLCPYTSSPFTFYPPPPLSPSLSLCVLFISTTRWLMTSPRRKMWSSLWISIVTPSSPPSLPPYPSKTRTI